MNLKCITKLIDTNVITKEEADNIYKEFQKDPEYITKQKQNATNNKKASAVKLQRNIKRINEIKVSETPFADVEALITRAKGLGAKTDNVEYRIKQVHATVLQPLAKHIDALRSKWGGLVLDTTLLTNITKTFFKGNVDDATANTIANAMKVTFKDVNELANKFGIKTIDDISQIAPLSNKIQGMTYEEFSNITKDLIHNPQDLRKAYDSALEGEEIFNEGLKFKSGDALAEYQQKIGGDSFSNLINYVDRMSADIASAHVLGKNAKQTIRDLGKAGKLSDDEITRLTNTLDHATGRITTKIPKGAAGFVAKTISSLRALGTAAMMGGSVIMTGMDIATMGLTARYNGLPMMKMYSKMIKNLVSKDSRMELAQVGFQLESVLSSLSNTSRFNPHSSSSDMFNKMATGVLRTSGLLAVSDAMKMAVKNTFLVTFKDLEKTTWKGLINKNPAMLKQLKQFGINEKDWNTMRKSIKDDIMLNPMKLTELDNEVGSKFFRLINEEADTAVITPGARSAHFTSLGKDKGTIIGETVRGISQFKSTIVEQVTTHLYRASMQQGAANQIAYASQYLIATTILGGMVYQLKELSKGNTPANPVKDPVGFFAESLRIGGAVPYFTDTVLPNMIDPKFGTSGLEGLFSPASLNRVTGLLNSGVKAFLSEDKEKQNTAQNKLVREIISMVPGNNIAYLKAATEYMKSYVGYVINPKEERKRQKMIERKLKKSGQKSMIEL